LWEGVEKSLPGVLPPIHMCCVRQAKMIPIDLIAEGIKSDKEDP
jgi:hypothetical protein